MVSGPCSDSCCSPASALETHQRKPAGEKMRLRPVVQGPPRTATAARAAGAPCSQGSPRKAPGPWCLWATGGHQATAGRPVSLPAPCRHLGGGRCLPDYCRQAVRGYNGFVQGDDTFSSCMRWTQRQNRILSSSRKPSGN